MEQNGPLGICHRLFNFIMNSFLTRGTRRMTSGTTTLPQNDRSQALETTKKDQFEVIRPNGQELLVEFRHTNGAMVNRRSNTSGQVLVRENMNTTQTRQKTDSQDQGNGNGNGNGNSNGNGNGGQQKSTLTIVEGKNLPGRRHHLLDVTSNINEKADDFIRSRKEAMEKDLSMIQNNDV